MPLLVRLQVATVTERFPAGAARHVRFRVVDRFVQARRVRLRERLLAEAAPVRPLARVHPLVHLQIRRVPERFRAERTGERLLVRVHPPVRRQRVLAGELLPAEGAPVLPLAGVVRDVHVEESSVREELVAVAAFVELYVERLEIARDVLAIGDVVRIGSVVRFVFDADFGIRETAFRIG